MKAFGFLAPRQAAMFPDPGGTYIHACVEASGIFGMSDCNTKVISVRADPTYKDDMHDAKCTHNNKMTIFASVRALFLATTVLRDPAGAYEFEGCHIVDFH